MKSFIAALLFGLGTLGLAACDTDEGPAEEVGEELDEAAEEVEEETE